MAAPVSPDDQMRVQKTFDVAAGPVRISLFLKVYIEVLIETKCLLLPLQDDRVNAKELMELFNSGSFH